MTFLEATQELLMARAILLDDVAHEAGVDILAIRRARLDPSNASYEKPLNWQEAMARLARKRARSLEALADRWNENSRLARKPKCCCVDRAQRTT